MTYLRRTWIATAVYALVYVALDYDRYATYHSGADLGLFAQTISSAGHGFSNTIEGGSHFWFHFSPLLYLFAPLLWLVRSPFALLAVQAVACALIAPPLFMIARRRIPERLAFGVALAGLLYPPLAGIAFSDFHENGLVPAATLWLFWAADARRWRAAAVFVAVCLCIKEDQALIVGFAAALAAIYFARRGDRDGVAFSLGTVGRERAGLRGLLHRRAASRRRAARVGAAALLQRGDGGQHPARQSAGRASDLSAGSRRAAVLGVFLHAGHCVRAAGFRGGVPVPRIGHVYDGQHYAAVWIGYVLAAYAIGMGAAYRRSPRTATVLVRTSLVLCVLVLLFASPTHWGHYLGARTAHHRELDRTLSALPPDLAVGTHDELYAHLGLDPNATVSLHRIPPWALFDWTMNTSYWVEHSRDRLTDPHGRYVQVQATDGITLYRRRDVPASP